MTKRNLCKKIHLELLTRQNNKKYVEEKVILEIIDMLFDHITESMLIGETVQFRGFGVFTPVVLKAKVGRNPRNPKISIPIPSRKKIKFTTSHLLVKKMNAKEDQVPSK